MRCRTDGIWEPSVEVFHYFKRGMTVKIGLSLLLIGVGVANAATPNLAKNGSFEVKAPASGCASATTSMYGWNIVAGNIDIDSELCSTIPAIRAISGWISPARGVPAPSSGIC